MILIQNLLIKFYYLFLKNMFICIVNDILILKYIKLNILLICVHKSKITNIMKMRELSLV